MSERSVWRPSGSGEMAERIREFDWTATPLGPLDSWPHTLRTAVDLMLASPQPVYIAWGPELISLYNDGYVPIAGSKHPRSLGQPYPVMWEEIWDEIRPVIEGITQAGESHIAYDLPLAVAGRPDRPLGWFTTTGSPIRDESGQPVGMYTVALETTDRVLAEQSLEASYRSLFETMDEGFALCELVRDAEGRAVAYRYLELNPALVRHGGIDPEVLRGRLASDAFPGLDPWLLETYTKVVDDSCSIVAEHYYPHVDRWLRINAFPRGGDKFAVLYNDITDRKRAEEEARESEERQAFLLKFSDALRAALNADAVAQRAIGMLLEQMRLDRCYITTYSPDEDRADFPYQIGNDRVPRLPQSVRLSDFPDAYEQVREKTYVIEDDFVRQGLTPAEEANSKKLGMRAMSMS